MNVLFVMPYSPFPPIFGGALREYHILKSVSQRHNVTIITYGDQKTKQALKRHFNSKVKGIHVLPFPWTRTYRRIGQLYAQCSSHSYFHMYLHSGEMKQKLFALMEKESFDIIQFEFSIMADFDIDPGIKKVMDAHNVEYENFRRMSLKNNSSIRKWFYNRESGKVRREELINIGKQDAIMVTSDRDKKILDHDVPEVPKYVLPNGVETAFFVPSGSAPEPHSLVFSGMMGYVPNDDAMIYFLDEIFPLIQKEIPDVKVYVVGNRPTKRLRQRGSDNIIVTGFVEDVRPYVWRASVYIVPLRMGSGTRLKVVEALSMKKPVVSTSIGCEGIDVTDGESVIIRDEPGEFADAVIQLLRDKQLNEKIAAQGHEIVRAKYDWSVVGRQVETVYEAVTNSSVLCNKYSQNRQ